MGANHQVPLWNSTLDGLSPRLSCSSSSLMRLPVRYTQKRKTCRGYDQVRLGFYELVRVLTRHSDNSIFVPGGNPPQVGFRRSELVPATNNGSDITVQGTTTFHWSIRNDPMRPLNFSHEYHVCSFLYHPSEIYAYSTRSSSRRGMRLPISARPRSHS